MKEFEYSFVVDSAEEFHAFCLTIQPLEVSVASMRRRVYKDGSGTIARVTEEGTDESTEHYLDFKGESPDDQLVKHVEETPKLAVAEEKIPHVLALLGVLDYTLSVDLEKKRTRYSFDELHVDVDEYTLPYEAVVVEIEGDAVKAKELYDSMLTRLPEHIKNHN